MQKNLGYVIPSIVIPDETNNIGYWYLGSVPLGVRATGTIWTIGNDHYWYVDGTKTNYLAEIPVETYNQQWSDLLSRCNNDWTTLKQECDEDWADWLATANSEKNIWFTNANSLLNNYSGQFSDMLSNDTVEFTEWFERIQGQLTEDAAGHLQTEIDKLNLVVEGLDSAVVPKGDCAFADLPAFADIIPGWMYNITDDFVSDSRFKDGSGKSYAAGTNVYFLQKQTGTETVVRDPVTKNGVTMDFDTVTDNSFTLDGTKKAADAIRFNLADVTLDGDAYKITLSNSGDLPNLMTLRLIGVQGNTETQLYTSNALGVMDILLTSAQLATYDRYYLRLFLDSGASKIFETEEYSITVHNVTQDTDVSLDLKHITQPIYTNYWDVLNAQQIDTTWSATSNNALANSRLTATLKETLISIIDAMPAVAHITSEDFDNYSVSYTNEGYIFYHCKKHLVSINRNNTVNNPTTTNISFTLPISVVSKIKTSEYQWLTNWEQASLDAGTYIIVTHPNFLYRWDIVTSAISDTLQMSEGSGIGVFTIAVSATLPYIQFREKLNAKKSSYYVTSQCYIKRIPETILNMCRSLNTDIYHLLLGATLSYNSSTETRVFDGNVIVNSLDSSQIASAILGTSSLHFNSRSSVSVSRISDFPETFFPGVDCRTIDNATGDESIWYDNSTSRYVLKGKSKMRWFPNYYSNTGGMALFIIASYNQSTQAFVGATVRLFVGTVKGRADGSQTPTLLNLGQTNTAPASITAVASDSQYAGSLRITGSGDNNITDVTIIRLA